MKRLIPLLLLLISATWANAQAPTIQNCATMEQDLINQQKYPGRSTIDDLENAIQKRTAEIHSAMKAGRVQATVITIPIVVHVIHNGEPVGSGTNISQAQIQSQIDVLNEDFRRKVGTPGENSSPVGADIEVEFCLSSVDQNGQAMSEPGIHRYRGTKTEYTKEEVENLKTKTYWNPNLFFNIWTLKFGGADALLLGYAQFPDKSGLSGLPSNESSAATDGVVVQYSSFGSVDKGDFPVMNAAAPYNHGRTLSHETGHWLGLRHIWGDGPCGDDFVSDTPTHHSENRGCPTTKQACNGGVEMPQNYMDYSNDVCMNIFTLGQKARILAVLQLSPRRKELVTANLCGTIVTAPPVANFSANKTKVLRGGELTFTDLSSNFPTEWEWTFENGTPPTSNVQNPRVKYTTPGKFKVSLKATNSLGSSPVYTQEEYIEVSEDGLCGATTNFLPGYTPSIIRLSEFGDFNGYLTGHNSALSKGVAESFANSQGYSYVSGLKIKFAKAFASTEDASATVTLWNARGLQNGPGSVVESKTVLLKQIVSDIENDRATEIIFDRETPVFSRAYHVGVELTYNGDTLVVESSANNEASTPTSWIESSTGVWQTISVAYGANIAMNISPIVGMNPSVQVASSKQLVNPGEQVILSARGASIFVWNANDASIQNIAGPQITVSPVGTTVYETKGSGLDLCNDVVETTIYVRESEITGVNEKILSGVMLYPNPGNGSLNISFENNYRGPVNIQLRSMLNQTIHTVDATKTSDHFETKIETSSIPAGIYITSVKIGENVFYGKWIKN